MSGLFDPLMMTELYTSFIDVVLLKGTAIVAAAATACHVLRSSSASVRHGVWAAAFFVLLASPVSRLAMPGLDLKVIGVQPPPVAAHLPPVATQSSGATVSNPEVVRTSASVVPPDAAARDASEPRGAAPTPAARSPVATVGVARAYRWIVAIWLVGLVVRLTRVGANLRAVRHLLTRSEPCPDHIRRRVSRVARDLGVRRVPLTIISPDIAVPSTFGLIRPTLVLPHAAARWAGDQLDAALLHEFGHLRRRDYVTHLVSGIVKAAYWVNPAVWYAGRRLDMERERACDDGVVVDRVDPVRYAEHLMSVALSGRGTVTQPALSFANRSSLAERVGSLLDRAQARTPLGSAGRGTMVAVATLAIATAGAIEIFGVAQTSGQDVAALSDPDPIVRRYAAWAAGESESPAHVDELIEHLRDSDARVRAVSAWALGEIKDPRAVEPLIALLADEEAWVREMAALAIGEVEHPSGLSALGDAGSSVISPEARAWAIAQIRHVQGYPEVFAGRLAHTEADVETRAADLPRYLEDLADDEPRVRARAAERLGLLGAPEAVQPLLDALEDEDPTVRAAAVWALDEINPSRARPAGAARSDRPGPTSRS